MTGRERYFRSIRGQAVDHPARVPILMEFAARYIGSHYGAFASDYRVLVEANLRCAADFGFDQVSVISDPYRETAGYGAEIVFIRDGVPRCPRPPLAVDRDPARLKRPDPRRSPRLLDRIRAVETFRERAGDYSILGWVEGPAAEAADLRGVTNFLSDLALEPEYAARLMDECLETAVEFARAQLAAGADTIGVGEAIVSQVSPRMYEDLIKPRQQRLVDEIRKAGGLVRLHICGDITRHLPSLAGLDVDVLDLDWMVDLAGSRRLLGPRTALAGNLDPAEAVLRSTPDRIAADLRRCYQASGNPYLVGAGCEIPAATPFENLRALCRPIPWRPNPEQADRD
ncbi:MAG TPA: uroporphyrinogen decarboxylase family protein [bacterium]|uniref:Uroporphyrinogen decarboxylase n=1 Tax=candidate division TA06 bacterium ADurb.Bin417 TaxID=1852828 RepID=A0A1V5M7Z8_UNCT6|nr:MAG: Uroporphyrinogen decarboxylase [candidate division TA06 bacterium ADurb.Bin417]HNQ34742.1 uroporphyrinogen decarboxylase family protein [bacterium]HNS47908.1 uroporphyrinogen decarboxylase family protein [bacterium]